MSSHFPYYAKLFLTTATHFFHFPIMHWQRIFFDHRQLAFHFPITLRIIFDQAENRFWSPRAGSPFPHHTENQFWSRKESFLITASRVSTSPLHWEPILIIVNQFWSLWTNFDRCEPILITLRTNFDHREPILIIANQFWSLRTNFDQAENLFW